MVTVINVDGEKRKKRKKSEKNPGEQRRRRRSNWCVVSEQPENEEVRMRIREERGSISICDVMCCVCEWPPTSS